MVALVTAGIAVPVALTPNNSAYMTSKLAEARFLEYVNAENPDMFIATLHPGIVDTAMFRKSGTDPANAPMDKSE